MFRRKRKCWIEVEFVVYLIHFDRPLGDLSNPRGQAQHYLGFVYGDSPKALGERLSRHRAGNGAAIMAAVSRAGIPWRLVRVWTGGRDLERRLKRRKRHKSLCPICLGSD